MVCYLLVLALNRLHLNFFLMFLRQAAADSGRNFQFRELVAASVGSSSAVEFPRIALFEMRLSAGFWFLVRERPSRHACKQPGLGKI